jgi:hypothetical protein
MPHRPLATAALMALCALPVAAQTVPIISTSSDPAMAAAMGELLRLHGGPGASVSQSGQGHAAGVAQGGGRTQATIVQQGCNHDATALQSGHNLAAGIFQFGCGSQVAIDQSGANQATIVFHNTRRGDRRNNPLAGRR